jgi:glycine cleavage system H protein
MEFPKDLKYTLEHEWIRVKDGRGVVGITAFAQEQLGDVVFVELPKTDAQLGQGGAFGVVESVKTVSDLFAPVSGRVTAVNKNLETQPELINADPYGKGWIFEIELSDPNELGSLLDPDGYAKQCENEQ